jgi:hypothetical protein
VALPLQHERGFVEDSQPLSLDLADFRENLWALTVVCNEGWRLLSKYDRAVVCAANGAVNACGIQGTSAHELVLRLADHTIFRILGSCVLGFPSRRHAPVAVGQLVRYLGSLQEATFEQEVGRIHERTAFLQWGEMAFLEEQLRSEYSIASSQPDVNGGATTAQDTTGGDGQRNAAATPATAQQGEDEKGGAGSTVDREAILRSLEPAELKAYYAYAYAEMNLGDTTVRQAYDWLSDNGLPDEKDSPELAEELAGYKLPSFDTWSRQLRSATKALGEQRYTRRAGRSSGGSVIPGSALDSQRDPD